MATPKHFFPTFYLMIHRTLFSTLSIIISVAICSVAHGDIITFSELELPGTGFTVPSSPWDTGVFRFKAVDGSGPSLASEQQGSTYYQRTESASLTATNSGNLLMTRIDGAPFTVQSVDLDALLFGLVPHGNDILIVGSLARGGNIQQTFVSDNVPGNQTVVLHGFDAIDSLFLTIDANNHNSGFANSATVDNIVVALPVPPSIYLVGSCLIGLLWVRRVSNTVFPWVLSPA